MSALVELKKWGSFVKFSHTVFALPFALSMFVVALKYVPFSLWQLGLLLVCLVSARTAAMSFNRIVDRRLDAENPRTCSRELVQGTLSLQSAALLLCLASTVFFVAALGLGPHCAVLAPLVLGLLFVYSLTKRFTAYSHLVLGVCLALAPAGVWYALTARFDWEPLPLLAGVLFWVAGFDLLYACQDIDIDRRAGLCSIPAKYGVAASLRLSLVFHVLALLAFILFGQSAGLGVLFYAGLMFFAALLFSQHRLISARNLSRVNAAFFSRNGAASIVFFIAVLLDRILV